MRILLSALPADTAAQDAAALAAAVSDLGALATVMVCGAAVIIFVARGAFTWLTAREERLKAQPPAQQQRNLTPPGGTPFTAAQVTALGTRFDGIEGRLRALELKEASASTSMDSLRDELRRDMAGLKESAALQAEAVQDLLKEVAQMRAQLDWATKPFGAPKTGG